MFMRITFALKQLLFSFKLLNPILNVVNEKTHTRCKIKGKPMKHPYNSWQLDSRESPRLFSCC